MPVCLQCMKGCPVHSNPWHHLRKLSSWVENPGRHPYVIPRGSAGLKKRIPPPTEPTVGCCSKIERVREAEAPKTTKIQKYTRIRFLYRMFTSTKQTKQPLIDWTALYERPDVCNWKTRRHSELCIIWEKGFPTKRNTGLLYVWSTYHNGKKNCLNKGFPKPSDNLVY